MSKRNRRFIILLLSMILLYSGYIYWTKTNDEVINTAPEIVFNQNTITVNVEEDASVLLQGVSAKDKEDGNISKNLFVYDISPFDENMTRLVTYGVFDSQDQLTTATRELRYNNYTAPRFDSKTSLMNLSMLSSQILSNISAESCVDGNISNLISMSMSENEDTFIYHFRVTDSTGTSASIDVIDEFNVKFLYTNISIELYNYILYVPVGTELNLYNYISNVKTTLGYQPELIPEVWMETNYNAYEPGVYQARYTINRETGDTGISKMIIVVE